MFCRKFLVFRIALAAKYRYPVSRANYWKADLAVLAKQIFRIMCTTSRPSSVAVAEFETLHCLVRFLKKSMLLDRRGYCHVNGPHWQGNRLNAFMPKSW